MTRAMDPEVADAIWAAIEPILPIPVDDHPLGCHNPRVPDRVCFRGILIRLVTGSSWVDIEAIMNFEVSDTTLRARRDAVDRGRCVRPARGRSTCRLRPDHRARPGRGGDRRLPAQGPLWR